MWVCCKSKQTTHTSILISYIRNTSVTLSYQKTLFGMMPSKKCCSSKELWFHASLSVYSVEPEGPQEEVSITPEPQPEPEAEVEPEPAAVELKPEPVSQPEVHVEEKTQRSSPSPTPADSAPTMPEENRVRPPSFITVC